MSRNIPIVAASANGKRRSEDIASGQIVYEEVYQFLLALFSLVQSCLDSFKSVRICSVLLNSVFFWLWEESPGG